MQEPLFRSSRPEVFCKKDIPKKFTEFTEKHLCKSFFNKFAGSPPVAASGNYNNQIFK